MATVYSAKQKDLVGVEQPGSQLVEKASPVVRQDSTAVEFSVDEILSTPFFSAAKVDAAYSRLARSALKPLVDRLNAAPPEIRIRFRQAYRDRTENLFPEGVDPTKNLFRPDTLVEHFGRLVTDCGA